MKKYTLCWTCQNAYNGCPWSRNFEPVPGWQATPTKIKMGESYIDSFQVHECPMFQGDKPNYKRTSRDKLAKLLNVSPRTCYRMSEKTLISRLERLGYKLDIYVIGDNTHEYYISELKK